MGCNALATTRLQRDLGVRKIATSTIFAVDIFEVVRANRFLVIFSSYCFRCLDALKPCQRVKYTFFYLTKFFLNFEKWLSSWDIFKMEGHLKNVNIPNLVGSRSGKIESNAFLRDKYCATIFEPPFYLKQINTKK